MAVTYITSDHTTITTESATTHTNIASITASTIESVKVVCVIKVKGPHESRDTIPSSDIISASVCYDMMITLAIVCPTNLAFRKNIDYCIVPSVT